MDGFRAALNELRARKIQLDEKTEQELGWVSAEIEKALTAKRYSRLRHLLDSYQVKKLNRILKDELLRSYLAVPQKYVDNFYNPREVEAKRVDKIPGMDSDLWEKSVATDVFSEVLMIEGKYRPKPAVEKTRVSILYDEDHIGFLFRCYDKEVGKVIAKKVERDGSVIAPDDDSVEVFLAHAKGNIPYYHFMGNFGRSIKDRKPPERASWYDPEWTVEAKKLSDSWLALITIPFKSLENKPQPGEVWGINLARNQRGTNVAFRSDPKRGFHCPDYFAKLKFE